MSIFLYEDIQWGEEAQIGFNVGDGHTSFTLPEALSYLALNVDEYSNVGEPGVFVFRIDSKSNASVCLKFLLYDKVYISVFIVIECAN